MTVMSCHYLYKNSLEMLEYRWSIVNTKTRVLGGVTVDYYSTKFYQESADG